MEGQYPSPAPCSSNVSRPQGVAAATVTTIPNPVEPPRDRFPLFIRHHHHRAVPVLLSKCCGEIAALKLTDYDADGGYCRYFVVGIALRVPL